jgi:phage-related minor tail protein
MGIGKDVVDGLVVGLQSNGARASNEIAAIAGQMSAVGQKASTELGGTFANAFTEIFMGTKKASEGLADLARQITQMAMNKAFTNLFTNLFSGGLGGGGGGSIFSSLFSGLFEKGAAFSGGRVTAFATGGVVSGPTAFPMRGGMGLMGEAGPEAIMPLSRGPGGKLGVVAQGAGRGGSNVTVNISNNASGVEVREVSRGPDRIDLEVVRIVKDAITGGRLDRENGMRYGLKAQPQGV